MKPALTQFGDRMTTLTGVRAIMKDIIETLQTGQGREFINLSAGNPVILPEIEALWRDCTQDLLNSPEYGEVVCRYGSSHGYQPLIEAVVADFNQRYGLELTGRNVLITAGSQSLYFFAANAFGGYTAAGDRKEIMLPTVPDYTGYGGVALHPEVLTAYLPKIERDDAAHRFKYRPDFDQIEVTEKTGCVLFSRPCNPTGNLLSDAEVQRLADLAAVHNVPVLVDSAYAAPYPALNFTEMTPVFAPNIIHCTSLSKAGLPGERLGIAIGDAQMIQVLEAFLTNQSIHSSRYGQAIAARAIQSGHLADLAVNVIRPHYQAKFAVLEQTLDEAMPSTVPWYLHRGEGAIFAWLWLPELPMTDWEFYQELKTQDVIVVPGSAFFPGLNDPNWAHQRQCLRISLTATPAEIATAMRRLATLVDRVHTRVPQSI